MRMSNLALGVEMVRVACTLGARIGSGSRSTVLSGGDGHVLVLGDPSKS
jgi:hypothetical protein